MDRQSLIDLGIGEDVVDKVMRLHGKTVTPLNAKISGLESDVSTLTATKSKLETDLQAARNEVQSITNTFSNDQEAFKAKYETAQADLDTEKKAHAAYRTEVADKQKNAAIDSLYADLLTKSGLRPDLIPNELKLVNRESLVLDKDGKALKDADKVIADAKTRWEKDFATETEGGAKVFGGSSFSTKPPSGAVAKTANASINAAIRGGTVNED